MKRVRAPRGSLSPPHDVLRLDRCDPLIVTRCAIHVETFPKRRRVPWSTALLEAHGKFVGEVTRLGRSRPSMPRESNAVAVAVPQFEGSALSLGRQLSPAVNNSLTACAGTLPVDRPPRWRLREAVELTKTTSDASGGGGTQTPTSACSLALRRERQGSPRAYTSSPTEFVALRVSPTSPLRRITLAWAPRAKPEMEGGNSMAPVRSKRVLRRRQLKT